MATVLWGALVALGAVLLLLALQGVYLGAVLRWQDERTVGLAYYGLSPAGRAAFKRALRRHARLLAPLLWLTTRTTRLDFRRLTFRYKGVPGPHGTTSPESFARGEAYEPRPGDVFVVTQMKCGTTWMQHLVYEVLHRGSGNLVESGTALYAVSPWLEGRKSVSLAEAPVLGAERPTRLIKTHFPAALCPLSPEARYIYVVRHPVSCFASCMDFILTNVGGLAPGVAVFEEWFCSPELMWWGTWPDHVRGWWDRHQRDGNVLWLSFEEMKRDLPGVARRVTGFLGLAPLGEPELARVVEKCSFAYMQRHQDSFEMHPPHLLQTNAELFVRGTADRHRDVPGAVRERLLGWSAQGLKGSDFPLSAFYPDVAEARGS